MLTALIVRATWYRAFNSRRHAATPDEAEATVKAIGKRLCRLEEQLAPADRTPREVLRLIVRPVGALLSLDCATCRRTLCSNGSLMEVVSVAGLPERPSRSKGGNPTPVTDEQLEAFIQGTPIEPAYWSHRP